MITLQTELVEDVLDEMMPLLEAHQAELHPDDPSINPNIGMYLLLDAQGVFYLLTARDGEELVGYYTAIVTPDPRHMERELASSHVIYLKPEHRHGSTAYRLFQRAMDDLKSSSGPSSNNVHIPVGSPAGKILRSLGYEQVEEMWEKRYVYGA